jgi:predicted transcriptional regulator
MPIQSHTPSTMELRKVMIEHMQQAISSRLLSAEILKENKQLKASSSNLNYHLEVMIKEGCIKQHGTQKARMNIEFTYIALVKEYQMPTVIQKRIKNKVVKDRKPAAISHFVNPFRQYA